MSMRRARQCLRDTRVPWCVAALAIAALPLAYHAGQLASCRAYSEYTTVRLNDRRRHANNFSLSIFGAAPFRCPIPDRLSDVKLLEFLHWPKAEIFCTHEFVFATVRMGTKLLDEGTLFDRKDVDIVDLLIKAETGLSLTETHDEEDMKRFIWLQKRLQQELQGFKMWIYEFGHWHWKYKPRDMNKDAYSQLYEMVRLKEFRNLPCPKVPTLLEDGYTDQKRGTLPSCPARRWSEIIRVFDGTVIAMSNAEHLANQNINTGELKRSLVDVGFEIGDPTARLGHGCNSIFGDAFIQKYPTDLWCYQMILWDRKPDVVIELGTSMGGAAVWFAATFKMLELPGVVHTVDIPEGEWRLPKRASETAKKLKVTDRLHFHYVKGGSTNVALRETLHNLCKTKSCMVVSDSDHRYEHTYPEIEFYSKLVAPGQYLVLEDTEIEQWKFGGPRYVGPNEAADDFARNYKSDFIRTDWCTSLYGLTQSPNGWFYRPKTI